MIVAIAQIDRPLFPPTSIDTINWTFVVRTLIDNRLAGLAYSRLSSHSPDSWPKESINQLEQHFVVNQFSNILLLQEANHVFSALKNAGIRLIALKGIGLIEDAYDLGARKLGDIDILVHPGEAQRAIMILKNIGYTAKNAYIPSKGCVDMFHPVGKQSVQIDLSWKFLHRCKFRVPSVLYIEEIFRRCRKKKISNAEVLVLDEIDQIIHIASHVVLHHELNFLPGLVDIYMIATKTQDLNWKEIERRAEQYGLLRTTIIALGVLYELFDFNIPDQIQELWNKLQASLYRGPESVFLDRFWILGAEKEAIIHVKHGGIKRNLAWFFWNHTLSDSFSDRIAIIIDSLWPSDERVKKSYGARNPFIILFFRIFHFPLFLLFLCIVMSVFFCLRPIFSLFFRRKMGNRLVGMSTSM